MKTTIKFIQLITVFSILITFNACKDDDNNDLIPSPEVQPKLTIELDHLAGTKKFYLDSTYVNANGDSFTPSMFKYYISNIRLVGFNNVEYKVPESYFLVNLEESESAILNMDSLPPGIFKSLKFIVGVDSLRNVSGAQSGALDINNGMFWTWSTGYIFMKMEGISPSITTGGGAFTYHIGGFQGANINYREVELPFDGDLLTLKSDANPEVHLVVNVLDLFSNPHVINMATFPSTIMSPNANSGILADNYSNMFVYDHIHAD
jgi:hypothetical protein